MHKQAPVPRRLPRPQAGEPQAALHSLTIFSVLLRLTSFLLLRRARASSMSMRRMRGMVLPPSSRTVKSTMMMVVVPMSWRFSMDSRPRCRLSA